MHLKIVNLKQKVKDFKCASTKPERIVISLLLFICHKLFSLPSCFSYLPLISVVAFLLLLFVFLSLIKIFSCILLYFLNTQAQLMHICVLHTYAEL